MPAVTVSDGRALGLAVAAGAAIGVGATLSSAFVNWSLQRFQKRDDTQSADKGRHPQVVSHEIHKCDPTEAMQVADTTLLPRRVPEIIAPSTALDAYSPNKRANPLPWDDYFMALSFLSAQRSKDPNKQVGACIVSQANIILSIGYNGFPRGIADESLPWAKKSIQGEPLDTKYPYVCHAEANAILNANTNKMSGAKIFVTMFPCNECAKLIIQSGIREVSYCEGKNAPYAKPADRLCYEASRRMLGLAGVRVRQHKLRAPISIGEGGTLIAGKGAVEDDICQPCLGLEQAGA